MENHQNQKKYFIPKFSFAGWLLIAHGFPSHALSETNGSAIISNSGDYENTGHRSQYF